MKLVEPIRSEKKIRDLKRYLLGTGNIRNYALIVFGMNSALRISDILNLTWDHVYDFDEEDFRPHAKVFNEMKTDKSKKLLINQSSKEALSRLFKSYKITPEHDDFIFRSREGENKSITRFMAAKIVKESCEAVGIKENCSCHTLRKTFGYWSWRKGVPIPVLMELYNHSSQAITMRYLGISQDEIDEVYKLVEL